MYGINNVFTLSFKFAGAKQITCYMEHVMDDLSKYCMNKPFTFLKDYNVCNEKMGNYNASS